MGNDLRTTIFVVFSQSFSWDKKMIHKELKLQNKSTPALLCRHSLCFEPSAMLWRSFNCKQGQSIGWPWFSNWLCSSSQHFSPSVKASTSSLSTTWGREVTWSPWSRSSRSSSGGITLWLRFSSNRSTSSTRITQRSCCHPSLPASLPWRRRRRWWKKWALRVLACRIAKCAISSFFMILSIRH